MKNIYFTKKIRKYKYSIDGIKGIGIKLSDANKDLLKFEFVGDSLVPSPKFGKFCKKNAYGYSYPDKTKTKEYRSIGARLGYPYGNEKAGLILINISRKCYPRIHIEPKEIELFLYEDVNKYVLAKNIKNLPDDIVDIINIFIEIYGECYVFYNSISIKNITIRKCNWKFLPPEQMEIERRKRLTNDNSFEKYRDNVLFSYNYKEIAFGINGYDDYLAFLFDKICVFETHKYGNATYIVELDSWEELSKLSKSEIKLSEKLICVLEHRVYWTDEIKKCFDKYGVERRK